MNDINFIKWKVSYAEGFEISDFGNVSFDYNGCYQEAPNIELSSLYLIMLHRAVIGINKHNETWSIILYPFIAVVTDFEDVNMKFGDSDLGQNQEKNIEESLKYIYSQEIK